MANSFTDKIGFLPYKKTILFNNGGFYPVEEYDENLSFIEDEANIDGYYYPPLMHNVIQKREVVNGQLKA